MVIPVRDGERYLEELLDALAREGAIETLVIDSGSRDRSREIASAAGVEVVEIAPQDFGHGRTRNLGAERTSGELICFLTQDATPCPGWLAAYREALALDERAGAAYGPHLPRPDTSPMIARELSEFFASFAPDGRPVVQRRGDATFLSNVNACYLRACWEQIRFRDVGYSEDQAFGADMLAVGWAKVYHPGAAVLHAHDYGAIEFMRRYFDEYRGLRESTGHVEPFAARATAGYVRERSRPIGAGWPSGGWAIGERALERALGRPPRRPASLLGLGSRAERVPAPLRSAMSLERRAGVAPTAAAQAPEMPAAPTPALPAASTSTSC